MIKATSQQKHYHKTYWKDVLFIKISTDFKFIRKWQLSVKFGLVFYMLWFQVFLLNFSVNIFPSIST